MTDTTLPVPPEISEGMRKRIVIEEQLKALHAPLFSKKNIAIALVITAAMYAWIVHTLHEDLVDHPERFMWITLIAIGYLVLLFLLQIPFRAVFRAKLERDLSHNISLRSEQLQENLDKSFFTNLVKINFKYIDKYYLQTQVQANKSFALSAWAACISLAIIIAGIVILFLYPERTEPGYLATASGVLGEFIATVFFYRYNSTIVKMGEYHEKLVLTQNIGLALRIAEDLPLPEKTSAQVQLVERLCQNINQYLTGTVSRGLSQ